MKVTEALPLHHKYCDTLFADAEEAASEGDWPRCVSLYSSFHQALLEHFGQEENALFPAFETATGMTMGPTQVMRMEHEQMREFLTRLAQAVADKNADAFAGAADTLLILMQQHNMKEENILYPMCDQHLGGRADLAEQLQNALPTGA